MEKSNKYVYGCALRTSVIPVQTDSSQKRDNGSIA